MKLIQGQNYTYNSVDRIESLDPEDDLEVREFPIEVIHAQTPSGMPPHVLNLKVDSVIILMRNISIRLGLTNGTRMRVFRLHANLIEAECIKTKQRAFIPRIPLSSEMDGFPFKLWRLQFPVRVGYAMTGNRGQGQTIERLGLYLPNPFFAHGQLYVAFSRIRNKNNIKVLMRDSGIQGRMTLNPRHFFTKNVVYRELLSPHLPPQPELRLRDLPNQQQLQQVDEDNQQVDDHDVDEIDGLDQVIEELIAVNQNQRTTSQQADNETMSQHFSQLSFNCSQEQEN